MVVCPICSKEVKETSINEHIDSKCALHIIESGSEAPKSTSGVSSFFQQPANKRAQLAFPKASGTRNENASSTFVRNLSQGSTSTKRTLEISELNERNNGETSIATTPTKRLKTNPTRKISPLAERMRPTSLDEVYGQELVGPNGLLRGLVEERRIPSMVLWGGPGTGKTTIARLIAHKAQYRFIEVNSTSTGVQECKKFFSEARSELAVTGRRTIIFCDELHRFNKAQQDVFLGPVEAGEITLIGATTENPSFKINNALLSRCRVFTLAKLTDKDIQSILQRALRSEFDEIPSLLDEEFLLYLATFSDGDARTALNLLELAIDLTKRPDITKDTIKKSLTQTLVYDRSGDMHYDSISAFHKSVRGSDPNAAVYYLARMLQSGEDPLYIARRMIVIASEDVGLADNAMLPLATATYNATEKIGMPECRINLAHCAIALTLAPKSTRAYRALSNAMSAIAEPGIAGLPIPFHLRNAPTRLMKELGYGKEYKYNPDYKDGKVAQTYMPKELDGRKFLEEEDLGTLVDPDLDQDDADGEDGNLRAS
jgi:putative ATPase